MSIAVRVIDVVLFTLTNVDINLEACISDIWIPEALQPEDTHTLSGELAGITIFRILRLEPLADHQWYLDNRVKTRGTTRPEDIAPEL